LAGGVVGGTVHSGASRNRHPPVASMASRASAATASGVPSGIVRRWSTPPITAAPVRACTSLSDGFPADRDAQWKAAAG